MILPNDVPNATMELKKRRSTRIVQAVPLVVTGVDALGRPFQERTSTLIINCHGCRYQSKHYVLKNMWVEMEIPHEEQGHTPRQVRGRVAWIQRPRTVRQLFQVAVELEVPGNIWSIAFPPEDWFHHPILPEMSEEPSAEEKQPPETIEIPAELPTAQGGKGGEEIGKEQDRLLPGAERSSAEPPDEPLTAMLAEAKHQIQAAAREAVEQAVAAEARATVQDWQARLAEAREHLGEEVARAVEVVRKEAESKARAAHRAAAEALKNELPGWLAPQIEVLTREIAEELRKASSGQRAAAAERLEAEAGEAESRLAEQVSQMQARIQEEAEKHVAALAERSAAIARELEEGRRIEEEATRSQAPEARAGQFAARLDTLQQAAIEGFQAQMERILAQHREEMDRRSQQAIEEANRGLQGAIADSGGKAAEQFQERISSMAQPQLTRAEEAMQRLAGARSLVDGALSVQEERVRRMTEEAFDGAVANFRERLESTEKEIQARRDALLGGCLEDLQKSVGQLQHSTINSLFQSAEWYEKKAQTQLQQALEKGIEQASGHLREKAGEISSVFAREVDAHSRNFVQHAQTQMEEVLRDAFERSRALFSEAAETTSAAFTDEIQRNARQELEGFGEALRKSIEDSRGQAERLRRSLGAQMTAEQESFLRRFRDGMTTAVEAGVNEAQRKVDGGLQEVLNSWRAMTEQHQEKMRELYGQMGDQSVDQFRGRLENVSNSWMVATATMIDKQSRDVLDVVAQSAEERLRSTCAQAFANIAETLREQLKEISASFTPPPASPKPMH